MSTLRVCGSRRSLTFVPGVFGNKHNLTLSSRFRCKVEIRLREVVAP